MRSTIYQSVRSIAVIFAAAFLCLTIALAGLSVAKVRSGGDAPKMSEQDRIEARINDLHAKLKITGPQEEQWKRLAEIMRGNAAVMAALVRDRQEKASTANAVEDLRSYGKITEAHAAGLNAFIPVFEELYAGMSDDQKKIADRLFTKLGQKKSRKK